MKVKLKNLLRKLLYNIFPAFFYKRALKQYSNFVELAEKKKKNLISESNWFNLNLINENKKSDSIYILGSGESICNLSDKDWSVINANDSFAINFNIMMEHIPTYYMFEAPRDKDRKDVLVEWIHKRADQFVKSKTPVILRDFISEDFCSKTLPSGLIKQAYITKQFSLSSPTKTSLKRLLRIFLNQHYGGSESCIPNYRSSVFSACYIAALLGYKNIYMVGFDLNSTGYFYEHADFKGSPIPVSGQFGLIHSTAIPTNTTLSIGEAINILYEVLMKERGINLYTTNPDSLLTEYLDFKSIPDN